MKLAIINITVVLLLFGTANSVPQELGNMERENAVRNAWEKVQALLQLEDYTAGDSNEESKELDEEPESELDNVDYPEALEEDYSEESTEVALEEDYSEESNEMAASQNNVKSAIRQGDTVALQTFVSNHWLGCAGSRCGRANCPRMMMSGSDWHKCWGEVFEIYRKNGPGNILVGDRVGLHYPREHGRWLGCAHSNNCGKATCPGHPSAQHGFSSPHQWHSCWGEVFYIFARGKKNGAVINSDDNIALYYIRDGLWVAQGHDRHTIKLPCLGKTPPIAPPLDMYDGCAYETFRIWKKW